MDKVIINLLKPLRPIDSKRHDRIVDLLRRVTKVPDVLIPTLEILNARRDVAKTRLLFDKMEAMLSKSLGYNLIVRNVPDVGRLKYTDTEERIGYQHMRDTFSQFGTVEDLAIHRGNVYIRYNTEEESKYTHTLVNNMMMGSNVITSSVITSS